MKYPWEQKPELKLLDYVRYMDAHVRVSVNVDGHPRKFFAVVDDGTNMNAEMIMLNGELVTLKVEGHPRTYDPIATTTQLVNYLMETYK